MKTIAEINSKLKECRSSGLILHAFEKDVLYFDLLAIMREDNAETFSKMYIPFKYGELDMILDNAQSLLTFVEDLKIDLRQARLDRLDEIKQKTIKQALEDPFFPMSILRNL